MTNSMLDSNEIEKFSMLAQEWWDPTGKFYTLHMLGPIRLMYLQDQICVHFNKNPKSQNKLAGLSLLDIGCGGGLICEPMKRLGADVTGIDPGFETIEAAKLHAQGQKLDITYYNTTVEDFVTKGQSFDVVLLLEVIEHVPDRDEFIKICANLLKPGGIIILSTLNRTLKSYAAAIVGAEYIMRLLPVGTHRWDRFVRPDELETSLEAANLPVIDKTGAMYNPLRNAGPGNGWFLSEMDLDVNYFMTAKKLE